MKNRKLWRWAIAAGSLPLVIFAVDTREVRAETVHSEEVSQESVRQENISQEAASQEDASQEAVSQEDASQEAAFRGDVLPGGGYQKEDFREAAFQRELLPAEASYTVSDREDCRRLLMEVVSSAAGSGRHEIYVTGEDYEPETLVIAQMFPEVCRISNTVLSRSRENGTEYVTCRIGFEKAGDVFPCRHVWQEEILETAGCLSYGRTLLTCRYCSETEEASLAPSGHRDENKDSLCDQCQKRFLEQKKGDRLEVGYEGKTGDRVFSFICLEENFHGGMLYGCENSCSLEEILGETKEIDGSEEDRIRWWLQNDFLNGLSVRSACLEILLLDEEGRPVGAGSWIPGQAIWPGIVLTLPETREQAEERFWRAGDLQIRNLGETSYRFRCVDDDYADSNSNYQRFALFLCETVIRSDVDSTDSKREIISFGDDNNYKYSAVRAWLSDHTGEGAQAPPFVHTGVNSAFSGQTAAETWQESRGEGLMSYQIPMQSLTDRLFLLSVEEVLAYEEAWAAEGIGSSYSRGYWLRTPAAALNTEGTFMDGELVYVVDLEQGCLRPVDVSRTEFGIRPAFCLPQG